MSRDPKPSRSLPLILGLALAAGCGGRAPRPADPDQARTAVRAALDAWARGESAETLTQRRPAIHVVDHEWRSGLRLDRYEVVADQPAGADLRCETTLWLRGPRETTIQKPAVYIVGTNPALTVVREDP